MRATLTAIGFSGWYPRGIARMIDRIKAVSDGVELISWVNCLPPGAPASVVEDGYDYTAYCAKPFALAEAMNRGYDIAVLLDAAFYPIRHLQPLFEYIGTEGYYLCRNGFSIGEWASDRALAQLNVDRETAFGLEEASSYCVGLDLTRPESRQLVRDWCELALDGRTFPGPHTNTGAGRISEVARRSGARNPGFCSADPRVSGHRHDQTALSLLAHMHGMTNFVDRPRFTAYLGAETDQTLLVNHGGL